MISSPAEIELPRLRQGLYRFFAVATLPPEQDHVEQLAAAAQLLEELGVDTFAFAEPWIEMRRSLATLPPLDELAARYVHLFESGSDGALCPPVESFYVASPRQGGPAVITADLESEFRRFGMTLAGVSAHGADHISPQLELMALLCAEEATAGERGDLESVAEWNQEQREFTDQHLGRWIPRFTARVCASTTQGFYRALVIALDAFVDHDRELLHVLERHDRTGARP